MNKENVIKDSFMTQELLELLSVLLEGKIATQCQKRVAAQIHAELVEKRLKRGKTW